MRSWLLSTTIAVAMAGSVQADSCSNSQLITENQFGTLLDHAPTCFKTGCGNPTSMSSSCAAGLPCSPIWDFIRPYWQEHNQWCKDCASDKGCWIPGWAVFNATRICNMNPNASLFRLDGCCTQGSEPIMLSQWLGGMCDTVEWRDKYFMNTYGMHPIDWFDHLRALNFTLRDPHRNVSSGFCDAGQSGKATLAAMGQENAIDLGETFVEIMFFWALIICGSQLGRKKLKSWKHALLEGFGSALMAVLGNLVTVLVWVYVLGYHDDRYSKADYVVQLFLVLCVRPSIVGYLCFLSLLTRPFEEKMGRIGRKFERMVLPIRRSWNRLRGQRRSRPSSQESDELHAIHVSQARQFLANWAFIIAFAELLMQALSFWAVFQTVNAGRQRQFYSGVLRPQYELASEARLWYAGGMLHIIFWIPSVFLLLASSYVHLNRSKVQEILATRGLIRWLFDSLNAYYVRREALENDRYDDRIHTRRQGLLKRLLLSLTGSNPAPETAPMLPQDPRYSSSQDSGDSSARMGWARRTFLNARIGVVSLFIGHAAATARTHRPTQREKEKQRERPSTPTETSAMYDTRPATDPFADPRETSPVAPGTPEMTPAGRHGAYQQVPRSETGDLSLMSSPYDGTRSPLPPGGHHEEDEHEDDIGYHGYYAPAHPDNTSSPAAGPAARWHRPSTVQGSSNIDDGLYENYTDHSAPVGPTGPTAGQPINNPTGAARPISDEPPAPGGPPSHMTPDNRRRRRRGRIRRRAPPFRLSGFILSRWPFRPILQSLYIWLEAARQRQIADRVARGQRPEGPDRDEFEALGRMAREMQTRGLPRWRRIALWGTFGTVTVNYVSQWLWWGGMVGVLGDRWCPPDLNFKLEKGIWAAGNAMMILVSLLFAMFGPGEAPAP